MVGIILATHGGFSSGIKQSASMLFGDQPNLVDITLMPNEGPADVRRKMEEAVASFDDPDQVLILVDLWGGTPFNQANGYIAGHEDTWAIIAGMNLPLLIAALSSRMMDENITAQQLAQEIIPEGKNGVRVYPESLQPEDGAAAAAPVQASNIPTGTIPEGTVLGDGHIKIGLARIDSRLLHGQVATAWSKTIAPDRIIVVSDNVSHDALRKQMIIEAAPPGIKAHVVPIDKMIEVSKDVRFGDTKALLLFETPQDALRAIKGGVDIKELNVGSMAHSQGKVAVNKVLSLGKEDVETYDELKKLGIGFDVRKVPSDSKEDMNAILNKARAEL